MEVIIEALNLADTMSYFFSWNGHAQWLPIDVELDINRHTLKNRFRAPYHHTVFQVLESRLSYTNAAYTFLYWIKSLVQLFVS